VLVAETDRAEQLMTAAKHLHGHLVGV